MHNDFIRIGSLRHSALLACATGSFATGTASAQAPARSAADWTRVEQALGRKGTMNPGAVMKFSFPRSDLRVTVEGVQVRPALALGSWVAFVRVASGRAMVMGDLVLTEAEVGPVMSRLQDEGIEQTALHNHLLMESPRVMYMHIAAHGDEAKIAQAVHDALALSKTPLGPPAAPSVAAGIDLDTLGVARELGVAGKVNGGVYQVSIPRRETIRESGNEVPPSMGVATAINFQPTGGGKAAITGDFVLRASEVNPVIHALRGHGIEVTALHSHMLTEEPRLFFMHFWANDDAVQLARGLRAALDRTASRR
ncbi:MAG: DUF1259 domain-containing protein [Gemmatimonadota bacterium]|nr:DUF1259 domain-containing protein [Gemmatimonadota bacterium]